MMYTIPPAALRFGTTDDGQPVVGTEDVPPKTNTLVAQTVPIVSTVGVTKVFPSSCISTSVQLPQHAFPQLPLVQSELPVDLVAQSLA